MTDCNDSRPWSRDQLASEVFATVDAMASKLNALQELVAQLGNDLTPVDVFIQEPTPDCYLATVDAEAHAAAREGMQRARSTLRALKEALR